MRPLPILNSPLVALIDDADYSAASQFVWRMANGYATRYVPIAEQTEFGIPASQSLQIFLMGTRPGFEIDHKDRKPLNCQRNNLRWATRSQNLSNQKKLRGTSKYKGVYWRADCGKWQAKIQVKKKKLNLGKYDTEEAAARAYDSAAVKYFGEFAWLNFPEDSQ